MADKGEEATFTQVRHAVLEPWPKQAGGSGSGYVGGSRLTNVFKEFGPGCAFLIGRRASMMLSCIVLCISSCAVKIRCESASVSALHALNGKSVLVREVLSIHGTTSKLLHIFG